MWVLGLWCPRCGIWTQPRRAHDDHIDSDGASRPSLASTVHNEKHAAQVVARRCDIDGGERRTARMRHLVTPALLASVRAHDS
ncbi:hypothetical protein PLICRDRAFT_36733 [Plicaturopsis crispa FD-325 SS-3]|nr:hypothetical protein PLICRDRAFT_36733 [Plicaturopsis crispa FD-325 SS-3]